MTDDSNKLASTAPPQPSRKPPKSRAKLEAAASSKEIDMNTEDDDRHFAKVEADMNRMINSALHQANRKNTPKKAATKTVKAATADPPGVLPVHPAAELLPLLRGDEFEALVEDIREHGLREPIVVLRHPDGSRELLDGRNRETACRAAKVNPRYREVEPWQIHGDPVAYVLSSNIVRRHMLPAQCAMAIAMLCPESRPGRHAPGTDIRKKLGISGESVREARVVLRHSREIAEHVLRREIPLGQAYAQATARATESREPEPVASVDTDVEPEPEPEQEAKPAPKRSARPAEPVEPVAADAARRAYIDELKQLDRAQRIKAIYKLLDDIGLSIRRDFVTQLKL